MSDALPEGDGMWLKKKEIKGKEMGVGPRPPWFRGRQRFVRLEVVAGALHSTHTLFHFMQLPVVSHVMH